MTAEPDYWTHSRNSDDQVGYQVKRPGNIQLAVLWQVFIGDSAAPASVGNKYAGMPGITAGPTHRCDGEEPPWQVYNHSPPREDLLQPPTSYISDKEKMPPPEHGQHVSQA